MSLDPARGYDLIGDVHGCALTLEHLLERLGYRKRGDVWQHPQRMALFLGDIIDRGPRIREALHLVHAMVEAGQALCIMGNHEYNALGWSTPAPPGSGRQFVREHTPRHTRLIKETLEQFEGHPADWRDFLGWFYELPLFLDGGRFRMVHACWDSAMIAALVVMKNGHNWEEVAGAGTRGIAAVMSAIFILLAVGALIGTWNLAGTIPTLVAYGIKFLQPNWFYPACDLIAVADLRDPFATGIGEHLSWARNRGGNGRWKR